MTSVLTPRPPVSGSPLARPGRRRRLRRRLLLMAVAPVALAIAAVMALVTVFSSGFGGLAGSGFGILAFDPNSPAAIVVQDPVLSGMNQEQLHNADKIIAVGMTLTV